jgi:hypothetical protein
MVESFLKGAILLFCKESLIKSCKGVGINETVSGLIGGFGGGIAQVSVLGPCTFLVTASVTGDKSVSMTQRIVQTWKTRGIAGFYPGGVALAFRQGTSWASRQGFTDGIRHLMKVYIHGNDKHKLSIKEEAMAGIIGGTLSVWNQPFEVMRIEAQAAATKGLPNMGFIKTFNHIVKESGYSGLFKGVAPRIGICIWQTLFMVTVPKLLAPYGF